MRHHTVTTTLATPPDEVFAYLADIERLPEWATEFARELRLVDGRHKVVNGQGEFFFEIHADAESGVIDMLAGPTDDTLLCFPTRVVATPGGGSAFTFTGAVSLAVTFGPDGGVPVAVATLSNARCTFGREHE